MIARTLLVVALVVAAAQAGAAERIKLTVSAGHSTAFLWVKHLRETFIPAVEDALRGSGVTLEWEESYGEKLARPGTELETIERGAADIGVVGVLFHAAKLPLQQITYVTPFGPGDPRLVADAMNELHERVPALAASWERHNQIHLVAIAIEEYGILARQPLARLEDLAGKRLAAPASAFAWVKGTGAIGTNASLSDYHALLKSGAADGVIAFASAAAPARLHEVAGHVAQARFGAMYAGSLTVNKTRWNRLPAVVRRAIRSASEEYARAYGKEQFVRAVAALDVFRASKATILPWSDAERARLAAAIESPVRPWLADAARRGVPARDLLRRYMALLRARGGEFARDWDRE